jgi:UPF0755 protein
MYARKDQKPVTGPDSYPHQTDSARRSILIGTAIALALLLLAACSGDRLLSVYLEANRNQLREAVGAAYRPVQFVVEPGTPARAVAERLQAAGLIQDARLFEAYVRLNGIADRLEAGTYTLSPDMTPVEIVEALQHSRAESITVTIPEGWRLEQIADFLDAAGMLDGEEYRRLALSGDFSSLPSGRFEFLSARPAGASLEGYLFPDTYELPAKGATAADLLGRQLDNFASRVLPLYSKAFAEGKTHLGLPQVLALASIVERESAVPEERPTIAGVYLNRLARDMKLEADPTVQYAMGYQADTGEWWKTSASLEEYGKVDSPYNTYLYPGLPPGPIDSPGLSSIQAVLYPEIHDYLYFVALPDGSGRHVFSKTWEEHLENAKRYWGQ